MRVVRRALLPALCLSLTLTGASLQAPPAMAAPSTTNPAESEPAAPGFGVGDGDGPGSGHRVEDLSQRDELSRVYANPDGTWTAETTPEPSSVQDADNGVWHDIDTTLVPVEGGYAPRYAATDVWLSAGGDKMFASVTERGKAMSWRWYATLPEPVIEGDGDLSGCGSGWGPGGHRDLDRVHPQLVLRERPTGRSRSHPAGHPGRGALPGAEWRACRSATQEGRRWWRRRRR